MTDKNHEILDINKAKTWLLSNVPKSNKSVLFMDASYVSDDIAKFILESDLAKNFNSIVLNGNPKSGSKSPFNENQLNNLAVISKKIESPFLFSVSLGRKSYLYLDQAGQFRASSDDFEMGRLLDSIHNSLDSLAWR